MLLVLHSICLDGYYTLVFCLLLPYKRLLCLWSDAEMQKLFVCL